MRIFYWITLHFRNYTTFEPSANIYVSVHYLLLSYSQTGICVFLVVLLLSSLVSHIDRFVFLHLPEHLNTEG